MSEKKKLIITVRVNEYSPRTRNKHIPFTPDEIAEIVAECRVAGASIIHFHARNADGSPCHKSAVYAGIVGKIRERCDILIDSTLGQITVKEDENLRANPPRATKREPCAGLPGAEQSAGGGRLYR